MGFPKVEFITVEDAVKVAIDRLELVEPQYKLWLWDEFAQMSFVTDNQFDIGYEQAKEDAIELLEKELHRKADRKTEPQRDCKECKYAWWNSEAKRYECSIEKCPYNEQTEPQTCQECEHWNDTEDGCADRHGCKTEPQRNMAEDIVESFGFKAESYRQAKAKDEPQTETQIETQNSNLPFEKADERCKWCNHYKLTCDLFSEICKYEPKDEPQTETEAD